MSSERRVVRPYVGLFRFQALLDQWQLRIGGQDCSPGQNLTLSSSSFRNDPVVITVAKDDDSRAQMLTDAREAAQALGLEPHQVEVVVVTSTPYLRLADIVHRRTLDKDDALPVTLTLSGSDENRALRTPSGGCDIVGYFCLAEETDPAPLRPHRRGTWFGRVGFGLRTELGELGFTPRPLTPEKRTELGLNAEAIRFVEVEPAFLLGENMEDAVELYVDEELLGHLNRAADSPTSRAFQRQLFVDVIAGMVRALPAVDGFADLQLTDIEGTVLGRIVEAVAGKPVKGESEDLKRKRREAELLLLLKKPEVFIANVEALSRPREDLRLAIGGFE